MERKYQDPISISPICKMVFAVNNLPCSPDQSYGLYRRIFILPFNKRFEGKAADKHLKEKLQAELPGILNWALEGLKRLRQNEYEFTQSKVVDSVLNSYWREQNPMLDYMKEMIELAGEGHRVTKASVKQGYQVWCIKNGLEDSGKMPQQEFWKRFQENCRKLEFPYDMQQSSGVRYLKRLQLKKFANQVDVQGKILA